MSMMRAILLLDDVSKTIIKTNISVLSSKGITIVTSLNEITNNLLKSTHTVFVLEGYAMCACSLPDLRLYKALMGLEYIYIGLDEKWLSVMEPISVCYRADITFLNIEIVQAAYYQDSSLETPDIESSIDEGCAIATAVLDHRRDHSTTEVTLSEALLSVLAREDRIRMKQKAAETRLVDLENRNSLLKRDNDCLLSGYSEIVKEAVQMNNALMQYEIIFTKDIYQKINVHSYNDRPQILYLKEQESFLGLDELIDTLYSVFRIQNRQSVKVLRLYDNSGCRRILTLPKHYKVLTNKYLARDIDANDYVCKSGDYVTILESLLLNRLHLDVLIIVDCKDHNDVVLSGAVLTYNLCQRYSSFKSLGLSEDNTITNTKLDNSDVLQWYDYDLDGDAEERFIALSARLVIQDILTELRQFQMAY